VPSADDPNTRAARRGYDKDMDAARFVVELQLRAGIPADVRDPIAAVRVYLDRADEDEAQALRLLIGVLLSGRGDFDEATLTVLTPGGAQLAAALVQARLNGLYSDAEWRSAAFYLVPPSS